MLGDRLPPRWALSTFALLSLAIPLRPAAAQAGSARIATISLRDVLREAPGYAQAESTYTREMKSYESEIEKLQKQFDSTLAAYQQQQVVLSPSAKTAKEGELRGMQQRLQQRAADLQTKASDRERELIQPIEDRVRAVIEGVRAERNLQLIIDIANPSSGVIASDRSLDLTATVVQRLKGGSQ